jgi:REP element-mobilizing transposase RayT
VENLPLAYFLTFSTYGTWLHGRDSGSVDRCHNRFDTPFLPADPEQELVARSRMRQTEYVLDEARRGCVLRALRDVAAHRGWTIWAAHVRTNHVHIVIATPGIRPEKVLADLKAWASRRLRETFGEDPDRDRWTQHGSTRYLWDENELEAAMDYVTHRQGEPMAVYPDSPSPSESEA